jgi:general secretion pathway protein J
MSAKGREAGFTLVEMMTALALFALIALAGVTLVDGVLGVQERTGGRLDRLGEMQRAMYVLASDLEQLARGPVAGGAAKLGFSRMGAGVAGVPVRVNYALSDGAVSRIVEGPSGATRQQLLSGVSALRWRFHRKGAGWVERWPPSPAEIHAWPDAVEAEMLLSGKPAGTLRRVVALPARP